MRLPTSFPLLAGVFVALAAVYERRGARAVLPTDETPLDLEILHKTAAVLTNRASGGYDLTFVGRPLGHFRDRQAAVQRWRDEARARGSWPTLYEVVEPGSLALLDDRGDVVRRW
jgi:hypothetical protein